MQAVDQRTSTVANPRFIRVMAGFGMIVAALMLVAAVVTVAVVVTGSIGSHPAAQTNTVDPFAAPGLSAFRASEHEALTPLSGDPFAAPSLVKFRQSEHAEAQ